MRFKATLIKSQLVVRTLQYAIEKISSNCIVHLTPTTVFFIVSASLGDGHIVWAEFAVVHLFTDFRVESKNKNEIMFEAQVKNLLRALKSASSSQDIGMRLTRDKATGIPYCTFEIQNAIQSAHMTNVTHDVPIEVYSPAQMSVIKEPVLADPEVSVELPPLKDLQHVVDRMKSIGTHLHLTLTAKGEMQLKVDTDMVYLTTFYKNLGVRSSQSDESEAKALVDVKALGRALHTWQIAPRTVICCIVSVEPKAVVLCNILEEGTIALYLPWSSDD
mmetsp:Transcript_43622/g.70851  ORF Transcript_43622/g.70851 Transcript_43622/m.70851 type:complete len:275 (-) Transcript_43622:396-1220(-)